MNNNLFFDFAVDLSAQTVVIQREFDASLPLVWDAFTKAELLDQWVAPRPLTARTKYMDFVVGGRRFYAMVTPEGQERWSLQRYTSITPRTNFKYYNTFADAEEKPELPGSEWDVSFTEEKGITKVVIVIKNESRERMERVLAMGFREGMAATIENLDQLLARISAAKG